jgi:hypothetical protein
MEAGLLLRLWMRAEAVIAGLGANGYRTGVLALLDMIEQ